VFLTAIVSAKEGGHEIGGFPFLAKPVTVEAVIQSIEHECGAADTERG
jgi:hypothetical protein